MESVSVDDPPVVHLSPRDIPPLPDAMAELLGIANDPSVSFDRLSQVIGRDQALTLRMLTVANSPYYGCSRRIDSVHGAIAVLGTLQVQNIASAMALAPAFESNHGPTLWRHGLITAVWTKHLMRALGIASLDYVFTAGLLHDIGVVLLLGNAPELADACIRTAQQERRPLEDVEREHFDTDHAALGAQACTRWNLPDRLAELVAHHHLEQDRDALDLRLLRGADALANVCDAGEDEAAHAQLTRALTRLDLDPSDLLESQAEVLAEASAFG